MIIIIVVISVIIIVCNSALASMLRIKVIMLIICQSDILHKNASWAQSSNEILMSLG